MKAISVCKWPVKCIQEEKICIFVSVAAAAATFYFSFFRFLSIENECFSCVQRISFVLRCSEGKTNNTKNCNEEEQVQDVLEFQLWFHTNTFGVHCRISGGQSEVSQTRCTRTGFVSVKPDPKHTEFNFFFSFLLVSFVGV